MIVQIVPIVPIVPVVSKKFSDGQDDHMEMLLRRSGQAYGNANRMIANDPDD